MDSEFNQRTETVLGELVLYRQLTVDERRIKAGKRKGEVSAFSLIGRVNGGDLELWKANGRWREDEKPHARDLAIAEPAHKG
jgi:hypothetical protein